MSLKKDFTSGVFYTAVAKYSGLVVQLIITAVLSRLLTPEDFGVVAIATILIQFFNIISEAGIGPAIIQKKQLSKNDINAIFTFTNGIGIFLCIGFYLIAPYISDYYQDTQLTKVCHWLSLLILFSSVDIVPNSLLLKQKKFKTIAIRTLATQIIAGIASIYVAFIGWGIYALVLSALLSKVFVFLINYYCNPLRFNFCMSCLRTIWTYSFFQFCANIINYFARNLDKLIIGRFLGLTQLGFYEKSYRLMMLPLSNITYVLTPVLHPIFSEMQNDRGIMFKRYLTLISVIGCISFPLTAFLFFNAKELIFIIFGSQWEQSVLPFKILSVTTALQVIHATASGIFQAVNDTKGLFISSLLSGIFLMTGFIISAICFKTIEAVSYSFVITCTLSSLTVFYILKRNFQEKWSAFARALKVPFLIGVIEFSVLLFFTYQFNITNNWISLCVNTLLILSLTIIILTYSKSPNIKQIISLIKK